MCSREYGLLRIEGCVVRKSGVRAILYHSTVRRSDFASRRLEL